MYNVYICMTTNMKFIKNFTHAIRGLAERGVLTLLLLIVYGIVIFEKWYGFMRHY